MISPLLYNHVLYTIRDFLLGIFQQYYMISNAPAGTNKNTPSAMTRLCHLMFPCFKSSNQKLDDTKAILKSSSSQNKESFGYADQDVIRQISYKNEKIFKEPSQNVRTTCPPSPYSEYLGEKFFTNQSDVDSDVEDYFLGRKVNEDIAHQYVKLRCYNQGHILLFGNDSPTLFNISTKVLSISPTLAEKTIDALNKIRNNPPKYPNKMVESCWKKRYLLFEKFDLGIKFDEESYISTPPEVLASYISSRMKFDRVVHAYPNIGAYDIKLSNTCESVIVTNVQDRELDCLSNNLDLHMIDNVEIITENLIDIHLDLKWVDAVLITPPWGSSRKYSVQQEYNLDNIPFLEKLIVRSLEISSNFVLVLPSNIDPQKLGNLLGKCLEQSSKTTSSTAGSCAFQIEKIYFLNRIRFIVVYYGQAVCKETKLGDQLNVIYQIIANDSTKAKRVVKVIREQYGMPYLLNLCLRAGDLQGSPFDRLVEIVKKQKIITEDKLNRILNSKRDEEGKQQITISQNPRVSANQDLQIQRMTYKTNMSITDKQKTPNQKQSCVNSKFTKKTVTESYTSIYEPVSGVSYNTKKTINVRVTSKASLKLDSRLSNQSSTFKQDNGQ